MGDKLMDARVMGTSVNLCELPKPGSGGIPIMRGEDLLPLGLRRGSWTGELNSNGL